MSTNQFSSRESSNAGMDVQLNGAKVPILFTLLYAQSPLLNLAHEAAVNGHLCIISCPSTRVIKGNHAQFELAGASDAEGGTFYPSPTSLVIWPNIYEIISSKLVH
jgi:hypothetical protein